MFFKKLTHKKDVMMQVSLVEAYLPVKLGHRDADKLFGEPLRQQLAAVAMGTVTECTAISNKAGEVTGVKLYLGLRDSSRDALKQVASMLDQLKAPLGSYVRLSEGLSDPVIFGATEGLELSIASTVAPNSEARRDLVMACRDAMQDLAVSRGWSRRSDQTVFYFYGESFAAMQRRLSDMLIGHPRFGAAVTRRLS